MTGCFLTLRVLCVCVCARVRACVCVHVWVRAYVCVRPQTVIFISVVI